MEGSGKDNVCFMLLLSHINSSCSSISAANKLLWQVKTLFSLFISSKVIHSSLMSMQSSATPINPNSRRCARTSKANFSAPSIRGTRHSAICPSTRTNSRSGRALHKFLKVVSPSRGNVVSFTVTGSFSFARTSLMDSIIRMSFSCPCPGPEKHFLTLVVFKQGCPGKSFLARACTKHDVTVNSFQVFL